MIDRIDPHTGNTDLWLYDASGGNAARFTFDPENDSFPIWSPDGKRIVWASTRAGGFNLYQKAASGAGQDELLLKSEHDAIPNDWSSDGRLILYSGPDPKTRFDVRVLPLSGDRTPFSFSPTAAGESAGKLSPDGRWIAYTSSESGSSEVYVQSFPSGGGKRQVSTNGGVGPQWRGDGKELFYYARDGKLMAVAVSSGATFEAGAPLKLFEFRYGQHDYCYPSSLHGDCRWAAVSDQRDRRGAPFRATDNDGQLGAATVSDPMLARRDGTDELPALNISGLRQVRRPPVHGFTVRYSPWHGR